MLMRLCQSGGSSSVGGVSVAAHSARSVSMYAHNFLLDCCAAMVLCITMTHEEIRSELSLYVLTRVSAATGVHKNTLWRIVHGYSKTMKPETQAALQAFLHRRRGKAK